MPRREYELEVFVAAAAAYTRHYGFVSKRDINGLISTAAQVLDNYPCLHIVTDEDRAFARAAITWARGINPNTENEFLYSLLNVVVLNPVRLPEKYAGVAASLPDAYKRHLDRQVEQVAKAERFAKSEFVGMPGERITLTVTTVGTPFELNGRYGSSYIYTMLTDEGNLVKWFGSNWVDAIATDGQRVRIVGTVKDQGHRTYKDVKETHITRAKVLGMAPVIPTRTGTLTERLMAGAPA